MRILANLRRRAAGLALVAVASAFVAAPRALAQGAPPSAAPTIDAPLRLVETYVPLAHLEVLRAADPAGVLLDLAEYRRLVALALARSASAASALEAPPPVAAAIGSARWEGVVSGGVASIEGTLTVEVAASGIAALDLGPLPAGLLRASIDGKPAWIVMAPPEALRSPRATPSGPGAPSAAPHAIALFEGRGAKTITLSLQLPLVGPEAGWTRLAGRLPRAPAARLALAVPGAMEAVGAGATAALVHVGREPDHTRIEVPLGGEEGFSLRWRPVEARAEGDAHISATHHMALLAQPESPLCRWWLEVDVARQAISSLTLVPPAGARVTAVRGSKVAGFARSDDRLEVAFEEPVQGSLALAIEATLPAADDAGQLALSAPQVIGARSDRGAITAHLPRAIRVGGIETTGLREIDPASLSGSAAARAHAAEAAARWPHAARRLGFAFARTADATLTLSLDARALVFEARSAWLAEVTETGFALGARIEVEVREGRAYALELAIPEGLVVTSLVEIAGPHGRLGVRQSLAADGRSIRLALSRAATPERTLTLAIRLRADAIAPGRDWDARTIALGLPHVLGGARSRHDLALALTDPIDLTRAELAGWRALPPGDAAACGLQPLPAGFRLALAARSEDDAPRFSFALRQRPPRGEARLVTHVLAAERITEAGQSALAMAIRTDVRVAVVDRAIDVLVLLHPKVPAGTPVIVAGEGIQAVEPDNEGGRQVVRFTRPWRGERALRLEMQLPLAPDRAAALGAFGVEGDFGLERYLALMSQGAVEVEAAPGSGLTVVDLDDLPDFAEPWPDARLLRAFRFRADGEVGTVTARPRERAPVQPRLARRLTLATEVSFAGVVRTHAAFDLVHPGGRALTVRLPLGARVIAAAVDGEPVRAVRAGAGVQASSDAAALSLAASTVAIPLPARTATHVELLYETTGAALGRSGVLELEGPSLDNVPVIESTWTLYYSEGLRLTVAGGDVRVKTTAASHGVGVFERLYARLPVSVRGHRTHAYPPRPAHEGAEPLSPDERRGAEATPGAAEGEPASGRLAARDGGGREAGDGADPAQAPRVRLHAQGFVLELEKSGGAPRVDLVYARAVYAEAREAASVALGVVAALALGLLGGAGWLLGFGVPLLAIAAFGPWAWGGSLATERRLEEMLGPFGEGLAWAIVALCVAGLVRALFRVAFAGRSLRPGTPQAVGAALALASSLLGAASAFGQAPSEAGRQAPAGAAAAATAAAPTPAFERAWVLYDTNEPPWRAAPNASTPRWVFLSAEGLERLWRLAGERPAPEAPPLLWRLALGEATYTLQLDEALERFELTCEVPVRVLGDGWASLALGRLEGVRLARVSLDGREVGVTSGDRGLALALRGEGERALRLSFDGVVTREAGLWRVRARLLEGLPAARMTARLPRGAALAPGVAGRADRQADGTLAVEVAVGADGAVDLAWELPTQASDQSSELASTSYTELVLTPDEVRARRVDLVRVVGRAVGELVYEVEGDLEVTEIRGALVQSFAALEPATPGGPPRLRVRLRAPASLVRLEVLGRAPFGDRGAVPGLRLESAVRAESFFGLVHGGGRRFGGESLAGLRRASPDDLRYAGLGDVVAAAPAEPQPERLFRSHEAIAGQLLEAQWEPARLRMATEVVAVVGADRVRLVVRARVLEVEGEGPARYVARLPSGFALHRVDAEGLLETTVEEATGRIVIDLTGPLTPGREITWSAEHMLGALPARFALTPVSLAPGAGPRGDAPEVWAIAAERGGDLQVALARHAEAIVPEGFLPLGARASYRLGYRLRHPDARLEIEASEEPLRLAALTVTLVQVDERALYVRSRVELRVRAGGLDRFSLGLPRGAELLGLETPNQRSRRAREQDGATVVDVTLASPAREAQVVEVLYRLPRLGGAVPALGPLVVSDAEGRPTAESSTFLGVLGSTRSVSLGAEVRGLDAVEPEAFPYALAGVGDERVVPRFRAVEADWQLSLAEHEVEVVEGVLALVRLADIETRIGQDGSVRTSARYTLENRGLQLLSIALPERAVLWSVTAGGQPIVPARGARPGELLVPLERGARSRLPVEVALTYEEPPIGLPGDGARASLVAPIVGGGQSVRVARTLWTVEAPEGYRLHESAQSMRRTAPSAKAAERLTELVEQQARALEAARSAGSRRTYARAEQDLYRLDLALADQIAELHATSRSASEVRQQDEIGRQDVQLQWAQNERVAERAEQAQQAVRGALAASGRDADEEAPDERAFRDRLRLQAGRAWDARAGLTDETAPRGPGAAVPDGPGAAGADAGRGVLERYFEKTGVGFRGLAPLGAVERDAEYSAAGPIPEGGLSALAREQSRPSGAGVRLAEGRDGFVAYTFRRGDGDARLTIELTSQRSERRFATRIGLAVFAAALLALAFIAARRPRRGARAPLA